jgi:hypothetical protein
MVIWVFTVGARALGAAAAAQCTGSDEQAWISFRLELMVGIPATSVPLPLVREITVPVWIIDMGDIAIQI